MKIEFSNKSKNEIIFLLILFVCFLTIECLLKSSLDNDICTISQYIEQRHKNDSIEYTIKNTLYAEKEAKKLFQNNRNIKNLHFDYAEYRDSLQAYDLMAHYVENGKSIKKRIVLKINFDINGGDYIIKPQIIKTRLIEN